MARKKRASKKKADPKAAIIKPRRPTTAGRDPLRLVIEGDFEAAVAKALRHKVPAKRPAPARV